MNGGLLESRVIVILFTSAGILRQWFHNMVQDEKDWVSNIVIACKYLNLISDRPIQHQQNLIWVNLTWKLVNHYLKTYYSAPTCTLECFNKHMASSSIKVWQVAANGPYTSLSDNEDIYSRDQFPGWLMWTCKPGNHIVHTGQVEYYKMRRWYMWGNNLRN